MHFGAFGNSRVEAAHSQQDGVSAVTRGDNVRSALQAEISGLAGRGLKTPEQFFTPDPAKPVAWYGGHRREG
jgi:hypothetical protein